MNSHQCEGSMQVTSNYFNIPATVCHCLFVCCLLQAASDDEGLKEESSSKEEKKEEDKDKEVF